MLSGFMLSEFMLSGLTVYRGRVTKCYGVNWLNVKFIGFTPNPKVQERRKTPESVKLLYENGPKVLRPRP
jgi:hypothetical protein